MASSGSGLGVRLVCLIITFLSLLLSIFIGFASYSEHQATLKYEKGIAYSQQKIAENNTELSSVKAEAELLQAQKDDITKELAYATKMNYYKTHPVCFLTFDDGPSGNTSSILDTLKTYNAPGTFFIVGTQLDASYSKTALQRITEEGHVVALHANVHEYSTIYASYDAYMSDFESLRTKLTNMTGITPDILRMPGGTYSAYGFFGTYGGDSEIYYKVLDELQYQNIMVCDWNVDTRDFTTATGVDGIVENALTGAKARISGNYKYKAVVLLMHNTKDTATALPQIISGLKEMGFTFEGLSNGGYSYRQK